MKNMERFIIIAIIVVPIIICSVLIKKIWSEEKTSGTKIDIIDSVSEPYLKSGDEIVYSGNVDTVSGESGEIRTMGGETYVTSIGDPISKIYSDALTSSTLANVYSEADTNSEVVGKFEKHTTITAQKFNQGWSRVTGKDSAGITVSGWLKTENIEYPDGETEFLNDPNRKTGVVTTKDTALNVRNNPKSQADIVTTVPKGTTVTIEDTITESGTNKSWYKITSNGVTGWASADYIKLN